MHGYGNVMHACTSGWINWDCYRLISIHCIPRMQICVSDGGELGLEQITGATATIIATVLFACHIPAEGGKTEDRSSWGESASRITGERDGEASLLEPCVR